MRKFIFVLAVFLSSVAARAESLNVVVLGVIAQGAKGQGVALIKHADSGRVMAYRVGAKVRDGLTLMAVTRRHASFDRDGRIFRMAIGDDMAEDASGMPTPNDPGATLAPGQGYSREGDTLRLQAAVKEHLIGANLSRVLMQAASEPVVKDGAVIGFSLWDIEPGSIYDVAGFRDGDVVTHINGQAINDAGRAIAILNGLKNAPEAQITYLRNGAEQSIKLVVQ